jgi:DNA-binding GntR family transcriptional regulator
VVAVTLPAALQLGIDPSARRPLRDEAYITLRRAILLGDFRPGDRLVEREVAAKLNLSRSPVREAFRRLEQEGLVRVSRQGLFVQAPDPMEMEELYVIRQHLEAWVAALAARNFQPEWLPRFEEIFNAMSAAAQKGDQEEVAGEGARFHALLAELAGNRRLARLDASIAEEIDRYRRLNLSVGPRIQDVLLEHRAVMAAVASGDEARASALMSEHIGNSLLLARRHDQGQGGR